MFFKRFLYIRIVGVLKYLFYFRKGVYYFLFVGLNFLLLLRLLIRMKFLCKFEIEEVFDVVVDL